MRTGKLEERDWNRMMVQFSKSRCTNFIDDAPSLPIRLRARAREFKKKGLSLILIDYLQLMQVHGNKENRATEISEISEI